MSVSSPPPPPPPPSVQRDFPLARFSTVRTGGPAELFARVGGTTRLLELLAWAHAAHVPVAVIGSGSNLLIADEGVAGLVLKLEGKLAGIERAGERGLECGGGARLPAVAAHAARAGLTGIEFGVNIPGTVGGAVRMNANAYGGALAQTLEWVEVASERGLERRTPSDLGFAYRSSNLRDGEVVARASFALHPAPPARVKATLAELRARRHEAQPQGIKTFGSTFKNPDGGVGQQGSESGVEGTGGEGSGRAGGRTAGLLLSEAGCNGLAVGGARFAPKHANFIENTGAANTAEIVALMAEGRRRVLERFGVALEPEVQTLGPVHFPWLHERGVPSAE
jgi:UDP-N-acetylenolpyruvoylglucosamine reductase